MAQVYFSKDIDKILNQIDFSKLGKHVGIKLHFGEEGCVTHLNPKLVGAVYKKVKSLGKDATLVECNVLYKGSRFNSTLHLKTARAHGFTEPIDFLDGETGEDYIEINSCKLGKGITKYDSLIILTHFKGHIFTGFGGALKNIGMGFGSRAGKLDMHSKVKPSVNDKCVACGMCIEHCNANAITMIDGKAFIDHQKCEGCAMCIAICNSGAINIPWSGRTSEDVQKRIAEYSSAVLSRFPDSIFINVLEKITKDCDCFGIVQTPLMDDIGILYSKDVVAIEKASLDLVNKVSHHKFDKINAVNKDKQVEFAEKMGLGSSKYDLINLDK